MRALTLLSLWLALYVTSSLGGDAVSVGHDNWGMKVYISDSPRECAPFRLYYDINRDGDPPNGLVLPDDARVSFLTPDSALNEWMVLRPPMGKGMLSWTCTLRAGKQFVVRNRNGYKQVFTVGSSSSGTQCGQNAPTVTTSSSYGSINAQVYKSLTANNYAPTSISPANQFSGANMPSTAGLSVINVPLGAAVPNPPANETPGETSNLVPDDKTTTPVDRSTSTAPGATDEPSSTGTSERGQATVDPGSVPNNPDSGSDDDPSDSPPVQNPGGGSSESKGSGTNIGAVVGGIIAALVLGALAGALFVCLARRRRRQKRLIEVTPMAIAPAPESPSLATTQYMDRKYPIPIPTVPTAGSSSVSGYETWDGYGTSVGTIDMRRPLSGLSEEPPQYSRFG
ncbi:hypothetical protein AURDEDRAFT_116603 [Auricularia subglabra TFB-10046 SS5]|nr:hypothetical protein AURDEDRAFT_116603 [Auricularia subglabra TFB-10046 SS5]